MNHQWQLFILQGFDMQKNKNKPVKIPKKLNKFRRFSEFMEREHDLLLTNSEIQ